MKEINKVLYTSLSFFPSLSSLDNTKHFLSYRFIILEQSYKSSYAYKNDITYCIGIQELFFFYLLQKKNIFMYICM